MIVFGITIRNIINTLNILDNVLNLLNETIEKQHVQLYLIRSKLVIMRSCYYYYERMNYLNATKYIVCHDYCILYNFNLCIIS